jgi:hypothetical protein
LKSRVQPVAQQTVIHALNIIAHADTPVKAVRLQAGELALQLVHPVPSGVVDPDDQDGSQQGSQNKARHVQFRRRAAPGEMRESTCGMICSIHRLHARRAAAQSP